MSRMSDSRGVLLVVCLCALSVGISHGLAGDGRRVDRDAWKVFAGDAGSSGWRVNVLQPDPNDERPDGFNHHDWDGGVSVKRGTSCANE
jgi:hypothetical protein